jgi:hypothetical protein
MPFRASISGEQVRTNQIRVVGLGFRRICGGVGARTLVKEGGWRVPASTPQPLQIGAWAEDRWRRGSVALGRAAREGGLDVSKKKCNQRKKFNRISWNCSDLTRLFPSVSLVSSSWFWILKVSRIQVTCFINIGKDMDIHAITFFSQSQSQIFLTE